MELLHHHQSNHRVTRKLHTDLSLPQTRPVSLRWWCKSLNIQRHTNIVYCQNSERRLQQYRRNFHLLLLKGCNYPVENKRYECILLLFGCKRRSNGSSNFQQLRTLLYPPFENTLLDDLNLNTPLRNHSRSCYLHNPRTPFYLHSGNHLNREGLWRGSYY